MRPARPYSIVMARLLSLSLAAALLAGGAFAAGDPPIPLEKLIELHFAEPGSLERFKAMKLDAHALHEFEANLRQWHQLKAEGKPETAPDNLKAWMRKTSVDLGVEVPKEQPRAAVDLQKGKGALDKSETAAKTQSAAALNDGNTRQEGGTGVPPVPSSPDGRTTTTQPEDTTGERASRGNLSGGFVPSPDKAVEPEKGEVVDEKFRKLLKMGALGAMAGAMVGIGLLPLLGPIGIIMGAVMGASVMAVGQKLAG